MHEAALGDRLATRQLGRAGRLRVVPSVGSTNDELRRAALAGRARAGEVLIARAQTAGRGRGDHRWESPAGSGLYLSALLPVTLPPEDLGRITLACGVALWDLVDSRGVSARLRWPNDVLVGERKLAGILCELVAGPDLQAAAPQLLVVAGIGLNVDLRGATLPPPLRDEATSLAEELGAQAEAAPVPEPLELVPELLVRLEDRVAQATTAPDALLEDWRARWGDRGRRLQVTAGGQRGLVGTGRGVARDGALLLETDTGPIHVISGTVRPTDRPEPEGADPCCW
ncbi:MAG: biotin--[acetyl-CoA-carboxylase] ligase [Myxococcota bacterium]|jgi:BirA family biotin operon repressor/biotin-[acetyl-CoA-carboxylase] ligase|nr:biotin--[acetyl-CoA-carboxylase] ligase [Myxococcota bacterium]